MKLSDCNHLAHVIVVWHVTVPFLLCFIISYLRAISKFKPLGAYIRRGDLTEGFLRYESGDLIHGGAYFRNFTVFNLFFFCLFVLFLVCLLFFLFKGWSK